MLLRIILLLLSAQLFVGCGGGTETESFSESVALDVEGETPFVHYVSLSGNDLARVSEVSFTINSKQNHSSRPISFSYSGDYLKRSGSFVSGKLIIPIVGLYESHANHVEIRVKYGSLVNRHAISIPTRRFSSADGKEYRPEVIKKIQPDHKLDYSFFYAKRRTGGPIVYDLDGEIRWTSNSVSSAYSVVFSDNHFIVGEQNTPKISRLDFTGRTETATLNRPTYQKFHHNIDPGKHGFLVEVDAMQNGTSNIESILAEVNSDGLVTKEWDFSKIISAQMEAHGDTPGDFVRFGVDWFHMNSATYSRSDDTLIISSRENFVIKIDYNTGAIIWILGDPTKYWYTFASLRQKALVMDNNELYPVGQHSLSVDSVGNLLLFDNGGWSFNQPAGQPRGIRKTFSAPRKYQINETARTAQAVFGFENNREILSDICSSAYETGGGSMLINYSVSDAGYLSGNLTPRFLGVGKDGITYFEFRLSDDAYCGKSWNASFIDLQDIRFN